jgi:hypothetical protein
MSKRIFTVIGLMALMVLMTGLLSAAAPVPVTTFTVVQGLPPVMQVGETYNVVVQVESDQPFTFAQALPSAYYPGRGVVAAQGDHAGQGTSATLVIPFYAKNSTAGFPGGTVPVSVSAGARYPGGYVAIQRFDFTVQVP